MKKTIIISLVVLVLFIVGAFSSLFIVNEGEQAVIIRLGKFNKVHTESGLKLKMPILDIVYIYSAKIQSWDGEAQRLPTSENQFVWVDATARWVISDAKKFYESVSSLSRAQSRLDDVIDSSVRKVVSSNSIREAVRNSNVINSIERTDVYQETDESGDVEDEMISVVNMTKTTYAKISKGRNILSDEVLQNAELITPDYGITLIDIVIRQIKYSDDLTESVYNRMIKERNQIAQAFRSDGEGKKAKWIGEKNRELRTIKSEAYKTAETIRGEADAKAAAIYSNAYSRDPEFYAFWKSLESYKETLPKFNKTLSTDAEYFNYLYNKRGK